MAHRALGWVESNLDSFSPLRSMNEFDEERVKPLCELALLCWLMLRNDRFAKDARIWSCLHFAYETYRTRAFFERLFRVPESFFVAYVLIAVALCKVGLLARADLEVFQVLIDRSNVLLSERPSHRQLELRHILDIGGFSHRLPSYQQLYLGGIAAKPINPIYVTDFDAYSLTHALFYCSDFGAQPMDGLSPKYLRLICRSVRALLGMYVVGANWDLVAELLLCCSCLNKTSSMLYVVAWKEIIEVQWESGVIPGPGYRRDSARELSEREKRDYVFQQCYHTTLVSALAGALCPWKG
jgi:hypothetical protein